MESALGFTKLACTDKLLNTTFPRACQKCYVLERSPSKWDLTSNRNFMICGFPLFANTLYPLHTWYHIYQHVRSQHIELARMIQAYQQEEDPPVSPTHPLARVPSFLSKNSITWIMIFSPILYMQLNFFSNFKI